MKKICAVSGVEFEVTEDDLKFYEKMGVPAPTLCPEERQRRRLAWRNERKLYARKCDKCGKAIISVYDKNVIFPVYCPECWWGDSWDSLNYGQEFNFSKPFFEQFKCLMKKIPHINLWNWNTVNSDYNHGCFDIKNCYLNFCSDKNEDCLYNYISDFGRNVVDCFGAMKCELSYELIDCKNCFSARFLQNCKNCSDSIFLKNCIGCSHCFGCINLRNKEYYFLNKKLSPSEWEKKVTELNLSKGKNMTEMRENFISFCNTFPHKFAQIDQSENVSGNYIFHSRDIEEGFDVYGTDTGKYIWYAPRKNDHVMDNYAFADHHWTYECISGQTLQNSKFIMWVNNGPHDSAYSELCVNNSNNLFGCIGLKHAQYCIFNKQYSKEEYFILRDKIIEHMKRTGEWGEFFPIELSPFAYNETVAQEYFPLTKEEAIEKGYKWRDKNEQTRLIASPTKIPDNITDVPDTICNEILTCGTCSKNYKIQKAELQFYRKMNLPIPHKCPDCRHTERMKVRNPRKLWKRTCDKCGIEIQTTFAPNRPEKVYCEKCYLDSVE